ncbi:hypothetical protein [Nocardia sp. NPDC019395]|uniref:hypothetical protein n=1 Tax=Nocardia sp. NPDC019395 TaxID=3154686 RepID=UPI00340F59FF
MSMILTALQDGVPALHDSYTVLAQLGNPTPEPPPLSDKITQMTQYLTWFVLLSGVTSIVFGGGKFAWEKWNGGSLTAPKQIAGAMMGGAVATSAGTIMNAVMGG